MLCFFLVFSPVGCRNGFEAVQFIPLQENTISCKINFTEEFGVLHLLITNISDKKIQFSKPRKMTKLDIARGEGKDDKKSYPSINAIMLKLQWDKNKFATLYYSEVSKRDFSELISKKVITSTQEVNNKTITLAPGESYKMTCNFKSSLVTMHNISSFDEMFIKGNDEITAKLILYSPTKLIAQSKNQTFRARCIAY